MRQPDRLVHSFFLTSYFATLPTVVEDECAALELAVAIRDGAEAGVRIELLHSGLRASDAA